ncbi:fungal-specific transcription factor domain-containing protein [Amylocystis lapponica]|nr:fungal-specific transcription factor domain-containing protein [Amylocystis lapponica]
MSQQWPSSSGTSASASASSYTQQSQQQYSLDRAHAYLPPLNGHGHANASAMVLNDDYDDGDGDELGDLPASGLGGLGMGYGSSGTGSAKNEKTIRRRSSKACDQCRKSKCKCERSSPQDPCRNCVMLGTACTFLGPSRKRGPPKGYIDAIEARLHQTEALIGILLASNDSRARSVLEDLSEDPLAKDIINRVDNSPYGHKGRSRGAEASGPARSRPPLEQRDGDSLQSTHPSNEWQDSVVARLNSAAASRNTLLSLDNAPAESDVLRYPADDDPAVARPRPNLTLSHPQGSGSFVGPSSAAPYSATSEKSSEYDNASARRQRRRVEEGDSHARSPSTTSISGRSRSPGGARLAHKASLEAARRRSIGELIDVGHGRSPEILDEESYEDGLDGEEGSGEDELAIEVGQLSLNEDEQVRFHGKVSGLHLLGVKEREDGRNEGGLWRFPKARVWPPLPPTARNQPKSLQDFSPRLPDQATQELLLELYFTYVHPALPVVHKRHFLEDFRSGNMASSADSPYSQDSQVSDVASPVSGSDPVAGRRRRVPTLLLLAMFSIAARYSSTTSSDVPPPQEGSVWIAGESYMEDAKVILDSTYAASRPSTCQALLLLGYREVGIGAMAQAWLYVGMAVRMAQDLGLHKSADQWSSIGRNLFSSTELQERRRIWYGCVIMDKYVSAYIGRPVAIFERDFDTALPSVEEPDETELWAPHPSTPLLDSAATPKLPEFTPVPGYIISCFSEAAKLSIILSMIMQGLYAIRSPCERQAEFSRYEKLLSKWYLELPDHLRFDPASSKKPVPPPHILTLHMQYWCTVLLMRRPFIRHFSDIANRPASSASKDSEVRATSRKNYDLCVQAANHITNIVSVYMEHFTAKRAPAFMCYYTFTAAIMHVATLVTYPTDPQARMCLNRCMDVLKRMQVLWPSAWRALELLYGAKPNMPQAELPKQRAIRPKRSAEHSLDQDDTDVGARLITSDQLYRQQHGFPDVAGSSSGSSPAQASHAFTMGLHLPAGDSSAYVPSYDRWSTEASLPNLSGSLSTSVLPQQYSTGLIDERIPHNLSRNPERHGQRYPQYWSDYSVFGQMDTTYGVPVMGDLVSQHTGASHGDQSGMYVHDQYAMFGNLPPPGSQQ